MLPLPRKTIGVLLSAGAVFFVLGQAGAEASEWVGTNGLYALERWPGLGPNEALYLVDPGTGAPTWLVDVWPDVEGVHGLSVAPGPAGDLYAIVNRYANRELVTIDADTGEASSIGLIDASVWVADIAFHCDGTLYGVLGKDNPSIGEIVIIDTTDASISYPGIYGSTGGAQSIAFLPGTNLLYHTSCPDDCRLEVIDVDTAGVTPIRSSPNFEFQALTYDFTADQLLGSSFGDFLLHRPLYRRGNLSWRQRHNSKWYGFADQRPGLQQQRCSRRIRAG